MNDTLRIIKSRRSTRVFSTQQISDIELWAILEAGTYAPSATNQQPWHFTAVQNCELIGMLETDFREYAKRSENDYLKKIGSNEGFHVFYNAPTVILISGEKGRASAPTDCAAATQNMLIQAESMGLGSCWIGFISFLLNSPAGVPYMSRLLIPESHRQIHAISIGYRTGEPAQELERKANTISIIR